MTSGRQNSSLDVDRALAEEASAISRRYKVDEDAALAALRTAMSNPSAAKAVEGEVARGKGRGAALRRLSKEARRHVYNDLRRYTVDSDARERQRMELEAQIKGGDSTAIQDTRRALLESHVSTRERIPSREAFDRNLADIVGHASSIVDLGCGLHPLAHPFGDPERSADSYLAIDKDAGSIRILETFAKSLAPGRLIAEQADLEHIDWASETNRVGLDSFDLAYLLKLVPVVQRQQAKALPRLAAVPAKTLVVSGSKESLARHQDISRREERIIRRFVDGIPASEVTRFETIDEIVYVIQR